MGLSWGVVEDTLFAATLSQSLQEGGRGGLRIVWRLEIKGQPRAGTEPGAAQKELSGGGRRRHPALPVGPAPVELMSVKHSTRGFPWEG